VLVSEQILTAGQGKHQHIVGFELIFNEALDASRAGNATNFRVTHLVRLGPTVTTRRVKLHAQYLPASDAVDLILSGRPSFGMGGEIDVNAAPPSGITDTSGDYVIGGPLGLPGIDPIVSILPRGRGLLG
jgi:hypothetical protein